MAAPDRTNEGLTKTGKPTRSEKAKASLGVLRRAHFGCATHANWTQDGVVGSARNLGPRHNEEKKTKSEVSSTVQDERIAVVRVMVSWYPRFLFVVVEALLPILV